MKVSEKTQLIRLRAELNALRRANHTLTMERGRYAIKVKVAERQAADLVDEVEDWKQRFDKLLASMEANTGWERRTGGPEGK